MAVFQEGVGASLIGADSGVPIVSFVPVMMFAILFGLSMDYNVFLLCRIHEAYNEGDSPRESVIHGMARIGKVILFAGLIMAAVFLSFVTQPDLIGKMFGIGLGLAILIDVLIVRMVIAPAVVTLLGDRAWWLPGWLDRMLPERLARGPPRRERGRAQSRRSRSASRHPPDAAWMACPLRRVGHLHGVPDRSRSTAHRRAAAPRGRPARLCRRRPRAAGARDRAAAVHGARKRPEEDAAAEQTTNE